MDESWRVRQANIEEKIIQFLSVEFILTYLRDLQYCSEIPPPTSNGGKAKEIPSCPCCKHPSEQPYFFCPI
jgi:hypothetical protein